MLIGKKLASLKELLVQGKVRIYFSEELFEEIVKVIDYPRIQKIISKNKFYELISLLNEKIIFVKTDCEINDCRDIKDNFLLELAVSAKGEYLITGDNDLLVLDPYRNIRIVTATEFENIFQVENKES
jgi:putative PIN family toxin of toxin-antitoxin system